MEFDRLPRKLAAILYADVAGYSRLTGDDEKGIHRRLSTHLDSISETIRSGNGTVVHYAGDAVLAEFPTVSEALICAAHIQRDLVQQNTDLPDDQKLQFRIGVNLGEVIVDRDDIYGDGVNVAARLESLAEPGGICISESVHSAATNTESDRRQRPPDTAHRLLIHYSGKRAIRGFEIPILTRVHHLPDAGDNILRLSMSIDHIEATNEIKALQIRTIL